MKRYAMILLGGAAILACPAFAKKEQNYREIAANRKIMYEYAKCVVKGGHDRAAAAILGNVDNDEIQKKYADLIVPDCLESSTSGSIAEMKVGGDLYRYALADALVARDVPADYAVVFLAKSALAHLQPYSKAQLDRSLTKAKNARKRAQIQTAYDKQYVVAYLSAYGECIVRTDPLNARKLLAKKVESPEEMQAINVLRPVFGECLIPGATVTFNKTVLRGSIAINYYRLAMPLAAPVQTGAK